MNIKFLLTSALFLISGHIFSQDTIFVYDIATQNLTYKPFPTYDPVAYKDSTSPSFGIFGITSLPVVPPLDTYPNTGISILRNASEFYLSFNYPFTAVTLVKYGMNITAAVIGKNTLLAFKYDIYDPFTGYRNLHNGNPTFENGTIQFGNSQLHPIRYYFVNSPETFQLENTFAVIETEENIGDSGGYFGLAFDTILHAYDSLLLYNISYPAEGYPTYYSDSVNGDTLKMKYGRISNPDNYIFNAYWGGNGEYTSPFFDDQFRIHGLRWSYGDNYKIGRKGFYFLKYITDSLMISTRELESNSGFEIYPNPSENYLSIKFFMPLHSQSRIIISDLLGREIRSIKYNSGDNKLTTDISDLSNGLYLLSLRSGGKTINKKFIKY